jgi:hypothetical protein
MVDLANVDDEKRWQVAFKSLKADLNNYEAAQKSKDEGLKKKGRVEYHREFATHRR